MNNFKTFKIPSIIEDNISDKHFIFNSEIEEIIKSNSKSFGDQPTILEIGNTWGSFSQQLLAETPSLKSIIVNPDSFLLDIARQNIAADNTNISFIQANFGFQNKSESLFEDWQGELNVCPLYTLDEFISQQAIQNIDLIIFDIRNKELEFLEGSENLLNQKKIKHIILISYSKSNHKESEKLLKEKGYKMKKSITSENKGLLYCQSDKN